ncbi:hypothetical protein CYY_007982 [Polysphondylium violaceum]|uniref:Pectin lyase-like family protein n=1 Tax=Polysphondylium violaceum TaxID=133409 RepID=A0A8J4PPY3_9MYCE|nr:hypothetical protein CYY_007982 [Polysphondylium violaceum]
MNSLRSFIFVLSFICFVNIVYSNSLTLIVSQTSNSTSATCGDTLDNACTSIPNAIQSYLNSNTNDNSTTSLTILLNDGTYNATKNSVTQTLSIPLTIGSYTNSSQYVFLVDFNMTLPLFGQKVTQSLPSLSISDVTFVNSYWIIASNTSMNVSIQDTVFKNVNSYIVGLVSLEYHGAQDNAPTFSLSNVVLNATNGVQSTNLFTITNYNVALDNVTAVNIKYVNTIFMFFDSQVVATGLFFNLNSVSYAPIASVSSSFSVDSSYFNQNYGGWAGVFKLNGENNQPFDVKFSNCTFIYNSAPNTGGALYISPNSGQVQILQSQFINNYVNTGNSIGGALYLTSNSNVSIDGCAFKGNTAYAAGGTIAIFNTNINISQSTFYDASSYEGGALYLFESTVTLNYNLFSANNANMYGADVSCRSSNLTVISEEVIQADNYVCPDETCLITSNQLFTCPSGTNNSSSDSPKKNNNNNNETIKIAIGVSCAIGGVIIIGFIVYLIRRHHHHHHHGGHHTESSSLIDNHHHHHHGGHHHHHDSGHHHHHHHHDSGHHHHHGNHH